MNEAMHPSRRLKHIINGQVYTPERVIERGVVTIAGDKIAAVGEAGSVSVSTDG